ncbi:permease, partial [Bacillus cereus]|nr:permease [Bacillus cereus]
PMLDMKNTLMLFAYFQKRFVFFLMGIVIVSVYTIVQIIML